MSGDSKTQGDYGELKLEMLLEGSGLEENTHYLLQKGFTVKSDGDVSREIPDAVIYLPQNRNIIIDSKFSFTVYNQYCNTDSDEEKQKLGKLLTKNIRDRINDLSSTKYNQIEELNTPDIIFMFLGIDDSLSVALKHDPELVSFADKKRIALVSPSILHISIKMVENLWRLDGQRASVVKVYEEAQKLVDKLHGFTNVMDSLGTSIAQSQKKLFKINSNIKLNEGSLLNDSQKLWKRASAIIPGGNSLITKNPDLLLLDEPTNHLDLETIFWLEEYLSSLKIAIIIISHDRYFLDNVAGWILELDRGEGIPWKGNRSDSKPSTTFNKDKITVAYISDYQNVNKIIKKYSFDIIFHFAAESHVDNSIYSPDSFIHSNILGTSKV